MAEQKKGLITRLLEGKEKSEEYARSTLPTNRWQLFWDIFKGNFGKIVKVNLLILIFMLPAIAVVVLRLMMNSSNGITYPFGASLGVGYPALPSVVGLSESLTVQSDLFTYLTMMIASLIAAVGIAGGMYVVRNMVWTEGIFVANDFWRGVKLNYKNALQTALFFLAVLTLCSYLINTSDFVLIADPSISGFKRGWLNVSRVISYVTIFFAALMSLWMLALGVNYKLTFFTMFRNAFLLTLGTFPQTIFFAFLALLPFALFLFGSGLFTVIAVFVVILFAFSYLLLVWLDYAQWAFDKFINPKIEGAKVGRGIYSKADGSSTAYNVGEAGESAASIEYKRQLLAAGKSDLVARPIKPIDDSLQVYELPPSFTRADLQRLRESKQNIAEDTEAYAEEHKNDLRYVEYNRQFAEREKALQDEVDKNGKKKKKKPPKLLGS
ncbi:MAG: hypothetical protein SPH68_06210 [Candidatus Borkfalkiaceae bacterium]|nr:hypothetical protein [Clostridia bacterium]MDY6223732.1 hypothetical protein [Christensenellaceae bacterium]